MRKILLLISGICVFVFVILIFPKIAKAADFDPNLLISDYDFANSGSMSASQIESFLQSRGSAFANYTIPEYINVPFPYRDGAGNDKWGSVAVRQYNDATGERLYGMRMSDFLAKEGRDHGINPQAMMVLMQRESSSITSSSISGVCRAWPVFYGFNEIMASYGYDYNTARARAIDFGGPGQQIAYATWNLGYRHARVDLSPLWIDGVLISPRSKATKVLYIYTPHIYNGNYNFWKIFGTWFGHTGGFSLIQKNDGSPEIYLLQSGKKLHIPSLEILNECFSGMTPDSLSVSVVDSYPDSLLVRVSGYSPVFVIHSSKKKWIPSMPVLRALYAGKSIQVVSKGLKKLIDLYPESEHRCGLIKGLGPEVYLTGNGIKNWIPDPYTFLSWGFSWGSIRGISDSELNNIETKAPKYYLVRGSGVKVYLTSRATKRWIATADYFNRFGFNWADIHRVSDSWLRSKRTGSNLGPLIRSSGSNKVYYLDNGQKRWIPDETRFKELGFAWSQILLSSSALTDAYPTGPNM